MAGSMAFREPWTTTFAAFREPWTSDSVAIGKYWTTGSIALRKPRTEDTVPSYEQPSPSSVYSSTSSNTSNETVILCKPILPKETAPDNESPFCQNHSMQNKGSIRCPFCAFSSKESQSEFHKAEAAIFRISNETAWRSLNSVELRSAATASACVWWTEQIFARHGALSDPTRRSNPSETVKFSQSNLFVIMLMTQCIKRKKHLKSVGELLCTSSWSHAVRNRNSALEEFISIWQDRCAELNFRSRSLYTSRYQNLQGSWLNDPAPIWIRVKEARSDVPQVLTWRVKTSHFNKLQKRQHLEYIEPMLQTILAKLVEFSDCTTNVEFGYSSHGPWKKMTPFEALASTVNMYYLHRYPSTDCHYPFEMTSQDNLLERFQSNVHKISQMIEGDRFCENDVSEIEFSQVVLNMDIEERDFSGGHTLNKLAVALGHVMIEPISAAPVSLSISDSSITLDGVSTTNRDEPIHTVTQSASCNPTNQVLNADVGQLVETGSVMTDALAEFKSTAMCEPKTANDSRLEHSITNQIEGKTIDLDGGQGVEIDMEEIFEGDAKEDTESEFKQNIEKNLEEDTKTKIGKNLYEDVEAATKVDAKEDIGRDLEQGIEQHTYGAQRGSPNLPYYSVLVNFTNLSVHESEQQTINIGSGVPDAEEAREFVSVPATGVTTSGPCFDSSCAKDSAESEVMAITPDARTNQASVSEPDRRMDENSAFRALYDMTTGSNVIVCQTQEANERTDEIFDPLLFTASTSDISLKQVYPKRLHATAFSINSRYSVLSSNSLASTLASINDDNHSAYETRIKCRRRRRKAKKAKTHYDDDVHRDEPPRGHTHRTRPGSRASQRGDEPSMPPLLLFVRT